MQQSLVLLFLMGQSCLVTCHLYQYHYINKAKNWSEARQYCRRKYTDLATVSNMTDMMRLFQLVKKEAWIGLYNETDSNRTWHWSLPGVEFNDSEKNWGTNEPNDAGAGKLENCVLIKTNLKWSDYPCTEKISFLCYDERKGHKKVQLIKEKKNWWEAQSYCRENHTDLASGPHHHEEQKKQMEDIKVKEAFIGLFRDTWRWSDGSSFSFRHWDPRLTNDVDIHASKQCAVMLNDSKTWKTCNCSDRKPFFCYDDKVILIQKKMNWEDALYYCRKRHHDLVSITSLDEQRWVQEKAKNATTPHVWTGLRYTCTLDFWFWVSDEAVSYENWSSGRDENECNMSGAMETGGRHQWVKINDNEKMNFICSKS